ncbi:MAG: hypothetical protein JW750_09210, partial [Anaerolineaceae bacterium]|nr:hypothetical protein [Anaerolineaceae bacterium]
LLMLRQYARSSMFAGALISLVLALFAVLLEMDTPYFIRTTQFQIRSQIEVFGRLMILNNADRALLFLIYLMGAYWLFVGAVFDSIPPFSGIVLSVLALLTAAIAVEPFLYAALFIEVVVLLCIPMLIRKPEKTGRSEVFFLVFMSLAVPFLLLAAWAAAGVEQNPADELMSTRAVVLLSVSFMLLLASFPFYVWVPKIAEQIRPARVFFLLSVLPMTIILLMLDFLNSFGWLRNASFMPQYLNLLGVVMIAMSGIWAMFQDDLGRLFGYSVILENGFALLALGVGGQTGQTLIAILFFVRMIHFGLLGSAMTMLHAHGVETTFEALTGKFKQFPAISLSILLSFFSIGALPLLAGFPARLAVMETVVHGENPLRVVWVMVGIGGFLFSGLRLLSRLVAGPIRDWKFGEEWYELIILGIGVIVLFVIGSYPEPFINGILTLLSGFGFLQS